MNFGLPVILDLCGGTGAWSRPYVESGRYDVRLLTLPDTDVRLLKPLPTAVRGILAAPPCTVFSYARNRYPPQDDELLSALSVVDACLRLVTVHRPKWWALENPRNKLRRYLGRPAFQFHQWEFGDPAHKPTCLWGDFTVPRKRPQPRLKPSTWRSRQENASPEDAVTPAKFAQAFFEANP